MMSDTSNTPLIQVTYSTSNSTPWVRYAPVDMSAQKSEKDPLEDVLKTMDEELVGQLFQALQSCKELHSIDPAKLEELAETVVKKLRVIQKVKQDKKKSNVEENSYDLAAPYTDSKSMYKKWKEFLEGAKRQERERKKRLEEEIFKTLPLPTVWTDNTTTAASGLLTDATEVYK